jgi:hypothetical protein
MVPVVETAEQARLVVDAAKYPPRGQRGAAFGIAHDDYETAEDVVSGMRRANDEPLLIAQIETAGGIENVEEISAVEGLDVLWIGHNDLTNSMGIPGQFDHSDYLRAVDRFLEACADGGKAPGIMSTGVDEARAQLEQGFRCVAYWDDILLYAEALRGGPRGVALRHADTVLLRAITLGVREDVDDAGFGFEDGRVFRTVRDVVGFAGFVSILFAVYGQVEQACYHHTPLRAVGVGRDLDPLRCPEKDRLAVGAGDHTPIHAIEGSVYLREVLYPRCVRVQSGSYSLARRVCATCQSVIILIAPTTSGVTWNA